MTAKSFSFLWVGAGPDGTQDDASTFMNNPGEGPHYPSCIHRGTA